jgi:hypothetical protein
MGAEFIAKIATEVMPLVISSRRILTNHSSI